MKIYEVHPFGELAFLLQDFKDSGRVVDYVLMNIVDTTHSAPSVSELHKAAAVFTIQSLHTAAYPNDAWLDPEKAQGNQIRPSEFFAPHTIMVNAHNLPDNPYLSKEDIDHFRPLVAQGENINLYTGSYTKAFHCPPYNLQISEKEAGTLFQKINHLLFGEDPSALTIYRWSTDWADYFHDGHEWWGSYLWTVENPQAELMIGLAASATD